MAPRKPDPLQAALARVHGAREAPETPANRVVLREALEAPRNVVVAAAAQLVGEAELKDFVPSLVTAFGRLMNDPVKADPMCKGKTAIAHALLTLDAQEQALFAAGLRHRQPEPVYGGSVDTAVELRGTCALGVLRAHHPRAPLLLAECLADREATARAGAAHALGELNPAAALPLLRYKLAIGDEAAEVIGACFGSFLDHAPDAAFELASNFLTEEAEAKGEAVALALGESRRADAFPLLRAYGEQAGLSGRSVAFVAMTLLRDETAWAYLVELIASGEKAHAVDAIKALANFRHDPKLRDRVLAAAAKRRDGALNALAKKAFDAA